MDRISRSVLTIIILFFMILQFSCKAEKSPLPFEINKKKFLNKNAPGKWKNLTDSHVPVCSITGDKTHKKITVTIPFRGTQSPAHYVEAILLLDHNRKELQKKSFKAGTVTPEAVFTLPADYRSFVYVVSKCNLHDMWEKKVFL